MPRLHVALLFLARTASWYDLNYFLCSLVCIVCLSQKHKLHGESCLSVHHCILRAQYSAYCREGTLNTDQSNQWVEESMKEWLINMAKDLWDVSLKDNLVTQIADVFTDDEN